MFKLKLVDWLETSRFLKSTFIKLSFHGRAVEMVSEGKSVVDSVYAKSARVQKIEKDSRRGGCFVVCIYGYLWFSDK